MRAGIIYPGLEKSKQLFKTCSKPFDKWVEYISFLVFDLILAVKLTEQKKQNLANSRQGFEFNYHGQSKQIALFTFQFLK